MSQKNNKAKFWDILENDESSEQEEEVVQELSKKQRKRRNRKRREEQKKEQKQQSTSVVSSFILIPQQHQQAAEKTVEDGCDDSAADAAVAPFVTFINNVVMDNYRLTEEEAMAFFDAWTMRPRTGSVQSMLERAERSPHFTSEAYRLFAEAVQTCGIEILPENVRNNQGVQQRFTALVNFTQNHSEWPAHTAQQVGAGAVQQRNQPSGQLLARTTVSAWTERREEEGGGCARLGENAKGQEVKDGAPPKAWAATLQGGTEASRAVVAKAAAPLLLALVRDACLFDAVREVTLKAFMAAADNLSPLAEDEKRNKHLWLVELFNAAVALPAYCPSEYQIFVDVISNQDQDLLPEDYCNHFGAQMWIAALAGYVVDNPKQPSKLPTQLPCNDGGKAPLGAVLEGGSGPDSNSTMLLGTQDAFVDDLTAAAKPLLAILHDLYRFNDSGSGDGLVQARNVWDFIQAADNLPRFPMVIHRIVGQAQLLPGWNPNFLPNFVDAISLHGEKVFPQATRDSIASWVPSFRDFRIPAPVSTAPRPSQRERKSTVPSDGSRLITPEALCAKIPDTSGTLADERLYAAAAQPLLAMFRDQFARNNSCEDGVVQEQSVRNFVQLANNLPRCPETIQKIIGHAQQLREWRNSLFRYFQEGIAEYGDKLFPQATRDIIASWVPAFCAAKILVPAAFPTAARLSQRGKRSATSSDGSSNERLHAAAAQPLFAVFYDIALGRNDSEDGFVQEQNIRNFVKAAGNLPHWPEVLHKIIGHAQQLYGWKELFLVLECFVEAIAEDGDKVFPEATRDIVASWMPAFRAVALWMPAFRACRDLDPQREGGGAPPSEGSPVTHSFPSFPGDYGGAQDFIVKLVAKLEELKIPRSNWFSRLLQYTSCDVAQKLIIQNMCEFGEDFGQHCNALVREFDMDILSPRIAIFTSRNLPGGSNKIKQQDHNDEATARGDVGVPQGDGPRLSGGHEGGNNVVPHADGAGLSEGHAGDGEVEKEFCESLSIAAPLLQQLISDVCSFDHIADASMRSFLAGTAHFWDYGRPNSACERLLEKVFRQPEQSAGAYSYFGLLLLAKGNRLLSEVFRHSIHSINACSWIDLMSEFVKDHPKYLGERRPIAPSPQQAEARATQQQQDGVSKKQTPPQPRNERGGKIKAEKKNEPAPQLIKQKVEGSPKAGVFYGQPAPLPPPLTVATTFVAHYYRVMSMAPTELFRFYKEQSSLAVSKTIDEATPVTGLEAIKTKWSQMKLQDAKIVLSPSSVNASQASLNSCVAILVTGTIALSGQSPLNFSQAFVLAPQVPPAFSNTPSYFVLNDTLIFGQHLSCTVEHKNKLKKVKEKHDKVKQELKKLQAELLQHQAGQALLVAEASDAVKKHKAAEEELARVQAEQQQQQKILGEVIMATKKADEERELAAYELARLRGEKLASMTFSEVGVLQNELKTLWEAAINQREQLMKDQHDNSAANMACIICQERAKSVLILPCRHLCLCQTCVISNELTSCPLCRDEIQDTLQIFL